MTATPQLTDQDVLFISEAQLAKQLFDMYHGDKEWCQKELYNHARMYPDMACSYWYKTSKLIQDM